MRIRSYSQQPCFSIGRFKVERFVQTFTVSNLDYWNATNRSGWVNDGINGLTFSEVNNEETQKHFNSEEIVKILNSF